MRHFSVEQIAFACLCLWMTAGTTYAQSSLWQQVAEHTISVPPQARKTIPDQYLVFALERQALQERLAQAPDRHIAASNLPPVLLELPMPNGQLETFQVYETAMMAPELAARYPMIRTYSGRGIDDPTATVRLDLTHKGFHAMILSGQRSPVFIDPYAQGGWDHYLSYYQKDYSRHLPFPCELAGDNLEDQTGPVNIQSQNIRDCQLRTYRLAMSCTAEYTQYHGGTKADGLAAMTTTMNRVNAIFERDLGVTMTFVPNMDTLIFVNPLTDPFDGTDFSLTLSVNQSLIDNLIGTANYDIGHVLLTQTGGSAVRGSVCDPISKADAASGNSVPLGDPLDVEFVAHEMGHQFGASHTNNACNAAFFTSVEPGSGSTIMSPMSCMPSIQLISDPYFHIATIAEMANYIQNGQGANCASITPTTNNPPTVEGGDSVYFVPISTPFQLVAVGNDPDGDFLTYCWEQMDLQVVTHPPLSTHESGPMFRSFEPVAEPSRYFPRLPDLLTGTPYDWEKLPSVSRDMTFRVTVRDNALPAGCIETDEVKLIFSDKAGPFLVHAPAGGDVWFQGAVATVQWEVARTDLAPIHCSQVDILLSVDGGFTYPFVLASQVPNDGYHPITVPATLTSNARVMVRSSDNVFFNVSDGDFTVVEAASPTFVGSVIPFEAELCTLDSAVFALSYSALAAFNEQVSLSATGLPAGASASFSPAVFTPDTTAVMTVFTSGTVLPGAYPVAIIATSATASFQQTVTVQLVDALPPASSLTSPADGSRRVAVSPDFSWMPVGSEAVIEIATNPGFGSSMVLSYPVNGNQYRPDSPLQENVVYYWRVRVVNECGNSENTEVFCFQTLQENCSTIVSTSVPVNIPNSPSTTNSTANVALNDLITDVNVSLQIATGTAGSITADLISPEGTTVNLFDRPRFPNGGPFGCLRDNILVTLDDETLTQHAWLEQMCVSGSDYAVAGTFQPLGSLSQVDGEIPAGTWTLAITNSSGSGVIEVWSMDLCTQIPTDPAPDLVNLGLPMPPQGTSDTISAPVLEASSPFRAPSEIQFTILSLPAEGVLSINGIAAMVGSAFTQADINDLHLVYAPANPSAQSDFFVFDVLTSEGGWIHADTFRIYPNMTNALDKTMGGLDIAIFPNPTTDEITCVIQQPTAVQLTLQILDVHGRVVKSWEVQKTGLHFETALDVRNLAAGPYQLLISDGQWIGSQRFWKL